LQNFYGKALENSAESVILIAKSIISKTNMNWQKPEFEEITLCMEVTAYVEAE